MLSRIPKIRITSRERVMPFKDSALPANEIGKALRVGAIVKGEVHRMGSRIGIMARWIDVATGQLRWSESESGSLSDLHRLQEKLIRRMSLQLGVEGSGHSRNLASLGEPWADKEKHSAAYLDYLKARHFLALRTRESLFRAIDYFQRAIAADPDLSSAYTGAAMTYDLLAFYEFMPPDLAFAEGSKMAEKGLLLDGESAEAYLFLGEKRAKIDHDWAGAEQGLRRAIALSPASPTAHQWYANLLLSLHRFDEAKREAQASVDLEPLSPIYLNHLGVMHSIAGEYKEAFRIFRDLIDIEPNYPYAHFSLGLGLVESGNAKAGVAEIERANALAPKSPMIQAALAYAHARAGERPKAKAAFDRWKGQAKGPGPGKAPERGKAKAEFLSHYLQAEVLSGLGETTEALTALEKALDSHDTHLVYLAVDPVFQPLRGEPRFQTILKRLNLAAK
jgi:serine/threonine-protein kinase